MTSSPAPISRLGVMPNNTADLDEIWTFLNTGIDLIMNDDGVTVSFLEYTDLYTSVYNYFWSTKWHGRLDGNRCMFHKRHLL